MTPKPFTIVQEICNKFVTNFNKLEDKPIYTKLVHGRTWKDSEFTKMLSEGTYQLTIILPTIQESLKNLPIGDSFFISTLEKQSVSKVQGSQHRFHNTSWYKDVKKLVDIVNRDHLKRCICQDKGIFLEVWYDENPEKRKNTLDSKSSSLLTIVVQQILGSHAHMSRHINPLLY
ncbi:8709_t:CDS:2 [Diversispora eburnea]|uniref:8709_t:CDS:1 n=1 Tax=Diversispora eburnea TaxID=1213867 RepID=A0A9N9F7L4_9GLOM|nr:8709_t:CDS:2 [Diversispora eburnea]